MSRTTWRRIRGVQLPRSGAYGWLTLKYTALQVITLGLTLPYTMCRQWNFLMNNKRFGSGMMSSDVKSKPLFKVWVISLVAGFVVFGGIFTILFDAFTTNDIVMILFGYLLIFMASVFIFAWFQAAVLSLFLGNLKFQDMEFNFQMAPMEYLKFTLMNMLILIFTLGFGAPFITQRWVRLLCDKLTFTGKVDFAQIEQAPEEGPVFGEGLAEAFDLG